MNRDQVRKIIRAGSTIDEVVDSIIELHENEVQDRVREAEENAEWNMDYM